MAVADPTQTFALLYPGDGSPENAVLRCLGGAGVPVAVARAGWGLANRVSRYCRRSVSVPPPGQVDAIDRLCDAADRLADRTGSRPVLFLLHDAAVWLGAMHRDRLAEHVAAHWLDPDQLAACNRHDRMAAAAASAGVPIPSTRPAAGADAPDPAAAPLPCVVKPVSKYVVDGDRLCVEPFFHRFGRKAFLADSSEALRQALERCRAAGVPVVVQDYVPGPVTGLVTVVAYAERGRVLAGFTGRKLRQAPPDCGTCTYGESCDDEPLAAPLAARLLAQLHYTGIAEIEFKRDDRDGELKLMEINPRATVFCLLANAAGVNLPLMAYRALTGAEPEPPAPAGQTRLRWMDPYRDLLGGRPTRGPGRVSIRAWMGELRRADLLAWGGRRDPLPLLAAPIQGTGEWLSDRFRPATFGNLKRITAPSDGGYLDYWRDRSARRGLSAVMWSNEHYNALVDRRQKRMLDRVLGDVSGLRVLDFCCGTGRLSVHLARRGAQVVGVDLACMIDAARQTNPHPHVTYLPGDVAEMELERQGFDLVLSVGTLPSICDSVQSLDAVIARLSATLRPGGRLAVMEPFHACPGIRRPLRLSPNAALDRFVRAGLRPVEKRPLLFVFSWMVLARSWWRAPGRVTAALFRLGEALLRVPGTGRLSDYKLFVFQREER